MGDRLEFNAVTVSKFAEAVGLMEQEFDEAVARMAGDIHCEVVAPFCDKWSLGFLAGNGVACFFSNDRDVNMVIECIELSTGFQSPDEMLSFVRDLECSRALEKLDLEDFVFDYFHVQEVLNMNIEVSACEVGLFVDDYDGRK